MSRIRYVKPKFHGLPEMLNGDCLGAIVFAIPGLLWVSQFPVFRKLVPANWVILLLLLVTIVNLARGAPLEPRGPTFR